MSRFFRSVGSESDTESSEDELITSDEEATQKPRAATTQKSAMSRFLKSGSSDSESESEDSDSDSDAKPKRLPLRDASDSESDESDARGAVKILSAQEKRVVEMESIGRAIENASKINDWVAISSGLPSSAARHLADPVTEFDKLARMIQRQQTSAYSIPPLYLRTLLSLDESLGNAISREKEAKKKMNATNARALTAMKQKVKKASKEYEHEIESFTKNSEEYERNHAPVPPAHSQGPAQPKKTTLGSEKEGDEFTTVGKGGKVVQFTSEGLFKSLQALQEARGKKNTDRGEQIRILEKLLEVAVTTYQRIRVLLALISSRFDYNSSVVNYMPLDLWLSAQKEVDQLVAVVAADTGYSIQEVTTDYDETAERSPMTEGGVVHIRGSIISFIDRLDDEFTRSLQNIDPHGTEYVERLRDERLLYCTICRAQAFYEQTHQSDALGRVIMRRLEHIYSKPNAVVQALESALDLSETKPRMSLSSEGTTTSLIHGLCVYLYTTTNSLLRTRAMLCHVYHYALHNDYYTARDMLLMSHLQESIHSADVTTQILYNRTVVQLGLSAFRSGLIKEAQTTLLDIFTTQRVKELLAQGVHQRFQNLTPEQEKAEKQRQLPFHMHINTELLEAAFLVSSMLVEIPLLASIASEELKRKIISKPFRRLLDFADRQIFTGPPESTRDHIMQASRALQEGDWERCRDLIQSIKIWSLMPEATAVKEMLAKRIQEQAVKTYLFTYAPQYSTLSLSLLSRTFALPIRTATSIISKMIWNEELSASIDQSDGVVIFHHCEFSRTQSLAQIIADKVAGLVDQNEKALDAKIGGISGWVDRAEGAKGDKREQAQERRGRGERTRGSRGTARVGRGARFAQGLGNQMPGQVIQKA
ncbi:hypothetical protein M378DRAFT_8398 [Amanita muscaria Koide BX008]|uniref:Eukaryotic translation initiation factor 3 subunit C n=1 Tax=Amanita muscaria (strain Koide BX008) TaxID=946122 RepID=A0A0C2SZN0_AMAMK|nr:hypothetical protein M378DRAFT_8398 [Amanita muscaria Koide BX008]